MNYKTFKATRKKLSWFYFTIYHRLEIKGIYNIPNGPALIVPNHSGGYDLDIIALSHCGHPKREIQVLIWDKYHYIKSAWGKYYTAGGIPLWLHGGMRWKYINPYLHPQGSKYPGLVCIFPEGNSGLFSERQIINQFFPGVVRIALEYQIPVVPTTTYGFHKAVPILKSYEQEHGPPDPIIFPPIPLPFKLYIEYGKPFELSEFYNRILTKEEETWIANNIIRPKVAKLRRKYTNVKLLKTNLPLSNPRN
mgnify:CR=1 FL=1